ncbi:MAG: hypothetical protein ACK4I8_04680, partial [Armatimonadota bacterium]
MLFGLPFQRTHLDSIGQPISVTKHIGRRTRDLRNSAELVSPFKINGDWTSWFVPLNKLPHFIKVAKHRLQNDRQQRHLTILPSVSSKSFLSTSKT